MQNTNQNQMTVKILCIETVGYDQSHTWGRMIALKTLKYIESTKKKRF